MEHQYAALVNVKRKMGTYIVPYILVEESSKTIIPYGLVRVNV